MSLPIKRLGRYKNGANRQRATKFAEKLKDPNFLKGLLKKGTNEKRNLV